MTKFAKISPTTQSRNVAATCPLCGKNYTINTAWSAREDALCPKCKASGRAQAISLLLTKYVFRSDRPLRKLKKRRDIKIIGLSDDPVYARPLSKKSSYINSFYHAKPRLDITHPPKPYLGRFDALISADVFEHVIGEPSQAFKGAFDVIKPGGYLILTVPFTNNFDHQEHYPSLISYNAKQDNEGNWIAIITYEDGRVETDLSPEFHGGPGSTLELRIFNRERLLRELKNAGFVDIEIFDDNIPASGINWNPASRPILARKPA